MDRAIVFERLKKFEGSIPHMYRCTGGPVTIGIGHSMPGSRAAAKLSWMVGGAAASASVVEADFRKVAAAAKGLVASKYAPLTTCRMDNATIERLAFEDIESFEKKLQAALPNWSNYPEAAQQALFDMAFNLGVGGLKKFRKMLKAVDEGDWETAAAECHRRGIGEDRNRETMELFRSLAVRET
jgi:lysozyme